MTNKDDSRPLQTGLNMSQSSGITGFSSKRSAEPRMRSRDYFILDVKASGDSGATCLMPILRPMRKLIKSAIPPPVPLPLPLTY